MQNQAQIGGNTLPELAQTFQQIFHTNPRICQAPGRVNLIGEHTDYNDGFVMPAAIGFYTRVAIAPRNDRKLVLHSVNFAEQVEFDLDALPTHGRQHWSDYVIGTANTLLQAGIALTGANLLIAGNVPLNSGLSSSAALEVATGFSLWELTGQEVDRTKLAQLCQQAENEFVGARVGIMDQFISCHGQENHALRLDCRSLEFELLPLPPNVHLVICNTMVKHSIADGKYNERRAECEEGVRLLSQYLPEIQALRDVSEAQFEQHFSKDWSERIRRRCRHVITENARVLQASAALEQGNLATFGQLMIESHRSLMKDYKVSSSELDVMVDEALKVEGVYGARMTGGGFGGCTINLVKAENVENFAQTIATRYERVTKIQPEIYVCTAADGASRIV
ncbi:MAG: galactokinase [Acidobacteria bacterium]|nr:galactokinase [Acidobacteriota bacterium]